MSNQGRVYHYLFNRNMTLGANESSQPGKQPKNKRLGNHSLICERFHAPLEMSILSNVHRCWLAMRLVAVFLRYLRAIQ